MEWFRTLLILLYDNVPRLYSVLLVLQIEIENSISDSSRPVKNADIEGRYELDSSIGGTEGGDESPFSLSLRVFMTSSASNLPTSP